jgi:hypothetical protein
MQNIELEKVKNRIRALSEKTVENGCTEAEAMSAATMVGRLLDQYALGMDECDIKAERCTERYVPSGGKHRRPIDLCLPAIASYCGCKVWLHCGSREYVFFGLEPDLMLAVYLYSVIDKAMANELEVFRKTPIYRASQHGLVARNSFLRGMARRVALRLRAMQDERAAKMKSDTAPQHPGAPASGHALVLVKNAKVEDEWAALALKLISPKKSRPRIRDQACFAQGEQAGDRVRLDRPLDRDNQQSIAA